MSKEIKKAIDFLAGRCDYAQSRDGVGFNGTDTKFGHVLADTELSRWSPKMIFIAYKMLKKYKNQLLEGGIEFDKIPEPPDPETLPEDKKYPNRKPKVVTPKKITTVGDKFHITFPYDPSTVLLVKQLAKRKFDRDAKLWIANQDLANVEGIYALINNGFEVDENVKPILEKLVHKYESNLAESTASNADIEVEGLNLSLYPFQKAGVAYAIKNKRVFIADEMGLGKTVQAIATIHKLNAYPAIIVCPASLKYNWEKEWNTWVSNKTISVWNGTGDPADIIIINYDMLKKRIDDLKSINAKSVVFDESHYLKNSKAQRTKAAKELSKKIEYRFLLTGTPIVNRPVELISQLGILGRLQEFGGFWKFAENYCAMTHNGYGYDLTGSSNLDELNERLRGLCFIRREKKEVLKELPEKIKVTIPVNITNRKDYDNYEQDFIDWIRRRRNEATTNKKIMEQFKDTNLTPEQIESRAKWIAQSNSEQAEHLFRIETLKQKAALGKMDESIEWIENFIESGEKLVIFGTHKNIIKIISEKFNCKSITGETSLKERQAIVEDFQNNPDTKLIVLNIKAGGVGLTLTAASNVLFLEFPWTPGELEQAIDRCHRIGQQNSVTAWFFVGKDTIDEEIIGMIGIKQNVVSQVTNTNKITERKTLLHVSVK